MARGYSGAFGRGGELAMGLDPALRAVRRAVHRRPRGPLRMLHLDLLVLTGFSVAARVLQRGGDRDLHAARRAAAGLPPGPHAAHRAVAPRRAGARPPPAAAARAGVLAGDRRRLPGRLPHRAERHRLQRHRRRLRGRHRRRPPRRRRGALRRLPVATTSTATRTARSPTSPTCRSSRCCRGAAPGTTCPRRTARRSLFDLRGGRCCSTRSGRRIRGPRTGRRARLRVGWRSRSRCSSRTRTPTTRCRRRSSWPRCSPRRARRARGALSRWRG